MERDAVIVAGFGFREKATLASLRAALIAAQEGLPPVTHLATAADKAPALAPLAEALGLPIAAIDAGAISAAPTSTTSAASQQARGTGSLAEAAAMAAIGPRARLIRPRRISPDQMATCAIAQGTYE
ncbi:cobalt-precorrin 5A hydrolase [Novosphingobium sp. SG751A]|uniref:cobalamin biosynthesis protein n=1 Tax=Novosphingobium sp. SG751A TaxID=2587000 RepID=UPI001C12AE9F|nr:cobalamin biosynthesis protein [Novosphingobium sp. SG751A]NOW45391.1 cobalt-precorrin 5A hydrolase [Novosphingobium sp. SG751A]